MQRAMPIALTPSEIPSPRPSLTGVFEGCPSVELAASEVEAEGTMLPVSEIEGLDRDGVLVIVVEASFCWGK